MQELQLKLGGARNAISCADHTGREFPSIQAMCDFWQINRSTYHNRLRAGTLLRQILTAPVKGRNS